MIFQQQFILVSVCNSVNSSEGPLLHSCFRWTSKTSCILHQEVGHCLIVLAIVMGIVCTAGKIPTVKEGFEMEGPCHWLLNNALVLAGDEAFCHMALCSGNHPIASIMSFSRKAGYSALTTAWSGCGQRYFPEITFPCRTGCAARSNWIDHCVSVGPCFVKPGTGRTSACWDTWCLIVHALMQPHTKVSVSVNIG